MVTGFLGSENFFGPRPFPVSVTPFVFRDALCPSSCGHSFIQKILAQKAYWMEGERKF